jgi:UDP-2,4-diacetamido-2,4,6-trideoxy-beta-L-altropyranose hydrolase
MKKKVGVSIPHVVFRADASLHIGSGHIMRCMTLGKALKSKGWTVTFITRPFVGNINQFIVEEGFNIRILPLNARMHGNESLYSNWLGADWHVDAQQTVSVLQDMGVPIDWLVVDHYAIDEKWEAHLREHVSHILVIDDLANRKHVCDVLLDQNLVANMQTRYDGKVEKDTIQLIGPKYALLRLEFLQLRNQIQEKVIDPYKILVFFGGSDSTNQTRKALEALLKSVNPCTSVDVVIGKGNPHAEELRTFCSMHKMFSLHVQTSDMARLLLRAGMVIGAGGTNTWERCCMGTPSVILSVADNQIPIAEGVHENGMAVYLGKAENVSIQQLADAIEKLQTNVDLLSEMSRKCYEAVDGQGVERVSSLMIQVGGG